MPPSRILNFSAVMLLLVIQNSAYGASLPDYIKVCSRNDPRVDECVKNAVHSLRSHLKNGIKELNVPAMEPLYIGDMDLSEGDTTGISIKVKKLNIYGASNFEIKKIRASDNARRFDFLLKLPRLQGEGFYDINGQLLALPLKGNGPFSGNFTNFHAIVKIIFDLQKVKGVDYVIIKDLDVKIRTGTGRIHLENLFGNKALGDIINETINQNFEAYTNQLIKPIERALDKKFMRISSKILESFTYDELFPIKT